VNPLLPPALQTGLVLASGSPRRAAILEMLGFDFEVLPTRVEENHTGSGEPAEQAEQLARLKAEDVAGTRKQGIRIGADTVVVIDGRLLNKPSSDAEALEMLQSLRGRWHLVHTGIALHDLSTRRTLAAVETTEVRFAHWEDAVLRRYVQTGEPADKAGAYAIQGLGAMLVQEIRGCYYNVMGFPVGRFLALLHQLREPEVGRAC
jgi:nucleoside triphosphate pyrophosphatase